MEGNLNANVRIRRCWPALLAMICVSALAGNDTFYERSPATWLWYQESTPAPEKAVVSKSGLAMSPRQRLRAMGQNMEEAESLAMLEPTAGHLQAAIQARRGVLRMAGNYADAFEQFLWSHPEYDYTLTHAQRSDRVEAVASVQSAAVDQALRQAAQHYGLLYVFRSDCPYCARFSPWLHAFADQFQFKVLPFSLDGMGTKSFPHPMSDPSLLQVHHIRPVAVPALYLVDPVKGAVKTVGYGLMNLMDLRHRVAVQLGVPLYGGTVTSIAGSPSQEAIP